ncbi:uncharacterized protein [Ovis canadensis]|uniref:uncharacterized protein n=1 Tax=Ovis canadensis TaxID=37174 RepID=UPI003753C480
MELPESVTSTECTSLQSGFQLLQKKLGFHERLKVVLEELVKISAKSLTREDLAALEQLVIETNKEDLRCCFRPASPCYAICSHLPASQDAAPSAAHMAQFRQPVVSHPYPREKGTAEHEQKGANSEDKEAEDLSGQISHGSSMKRKGCLFLYSFGRGLGVALPGDVELTRRIYQGAVHQPAAVTEAEA